LQPWGDELAMFEQIWLAGCGNMAGAMLEGWLRAGLEPERFLAIRPSGAPVAGGVRVVAGPPPDEEAPDLLLLGFKPQQFGDAAPAYARHAGAGTTVLSILAGVELASLRAAFPGAGAVVRAMPNLPVRLGKGVTGLVAEGGAQPGGVSALLAPLGLVEWVDSEDALDALSALAGSGPAFVYRFIDALGGGGEALGLPPEQATRLALATVAGAGALAAASPLPPASLADQVASPGGSTRQGLNVLDEDEALRALLRRTLAAARARVVEMRAEARRPGGPAGVIGA